MELASSALVARGGEGVSTSHFQPRRHLYVLRDLILDEELDEANEEEIEREVEFDENDLVADAILGLGAVKEQPSIIKLSWKRRS